MFCCMPKAEREKGEISKNIDKRLKAKQIHRESNTHILLLGPGGSGKSTVLKQMKIITDVDLGDKATFKRQINKNICEGISVLINAMEFYKVTFADQSLNGIALKFKNPTEEEIYELTPEKANLILKLWKDPNTQEVYKKRNTFQLSDNAAYFLNKIATFAEPNYVPVNEDIVRIRDRTVEVFHQLITFEGIRLNMIDVGGQRKERTKWLDIFSFVKVIIYIAGISEYDQVLEEDGRTNRLAESIDLFGDILKRPCLFPVSFILFLNKIDLFADKLKYKPITVLFPEYRGKQNISESCSFIREKFKNMNLIKTRSIYAYQTCATDTDNIKKVFVSVKNTALKSVLLDGGLIG